MKKILLAACVVFGTAFVVAANHLRTSNHWLLASIFEMFGLICAMEFVWTLEESRKREGDK